MKRAWLFKVSVTWMLLGMVACREMEGPPHPNALERMNAAVEKNRYTPLVFQARRIYQGFGQDSPVAAIIRWWFKADSADTLVGGQFYAEYYEDEGTSPVLSLWYWSDSAWLARHQDSVIRSITVDQAQQYFWRLGVHHLDMLWQGIDTQQLQQDSVQWIASDSLIITYSPGTGGKEDPRNLRDSIWVGPDGMVQRYVRRSEWLFMQSMTQWDIEKYQHSLGEVSKRLTPQIPDGYIYEPHIPETAKSDEEQAEEFDWMAPLKAMEGKIAPDFSMLEMDGDSMQLSDLKGRPVILDFWYVGCYWCSKAVPHIARLYREYHHKGLEVIGVNPYDDLEAIAQYHQYWELPYRVAQIDRKVTKQYHIVGYPTMLMITPAGRIHRVWFGYSDSLYDKLLPVVDSLVGMIP